MKTSYVYFNEDIDADKIGRLIDRLQEIKGNIRLYFSTEGGFTNPMKYLVDYLNNRKEEITVVLTDELSSAGTLILIEFEGIIETRDVDVMLFHCFDRRQYNIRKGIVCAKTLTRIGVNENKIMAQKLLDKGWFDQRQKKKFLRGEDVVMYKDEIERKLAEIVKEKLK